MGPKVISFHYTLKDHDGKVLESSTGDEPLSFLQGVGQIIPGLENVLGGMKIGDKQTILVTADQAYGEYDESMIVEVPRAQIPKPDVKVGDQFQADSGGGHAQVVVVTKVTDTAVTVDANHPLAGQDLTFDVEIMAVREASKEEMEHGHAHGPGGHHH